MSRHAIIDRQGNVVNIIEWEGAEWLPPRNHYVIQSDTADVGDQYNFITKQFTKWHIINAAKRAT